MKFARYWVRETLPVTGSGDPADSVGVWGWSEESEDEARRRSLDLTERFLAAFKSRFQTPWRGEYGYEDRPVREEVLREFRDDAGELTAAITRNAYGVQVLNTQRLMFVDADLPRPPRAASGGVWGSLRALLGKRPPADAAAAPAFNPEGVVLDRVRRWSADHPHVALRLYRTAAGFRGLVTSPEIDARDAMADTLLATAGSDPLYRQLCKAQECFRARLTPKPWRVDFAPPPHAWPWRDASAEQEVRAWQRGYDAAVQGYATCRFLERLGPEVTAPALAPFVELHDGLTRATSDLPLA